MNVVTDTSAWIEWLIGSPTAEALADNWPKPNQTLVPTLVQHELAKWLKREVSEYAMDQALPYLEQCMVIDLGTRIALNAAELCAAKKLSTADAIIYATAIQHDAVLLTCDAHFDALAGVNFISKMA